MEVENNIEKYIIIYLSKINYKGDITLMSRYISSVYSYINRRLSNKNDLIPRVRELDLLCLVNIDDLIERYIDYHENLLPLLNGYLENLDKTAEITLLFCRNYINELTDFVLNNHKAYERHLKISNILY